MERDSLVYKGMLRSVAELLERHGGCWFVSNRQTAFCDWKKTSSWLWGYGYGYYVVPIHRPCRQMSATKPCSQLAFYFSDLHCTLHRTHPTKRPWLCFFGRHLLTAKLAEQAERFDEMVADMKEVAKQKQELTVEERNLLSVAYKNVIGSRRASWRVVTSIEQKGDPERMTVIKDYKSKIETELLDICQDILSIIEESLIPNSTSEEAKVFYYKMKGDYHRYLSEFQSADVRKGSASAALDAYQAATGIAQSDLPPTHPIRLGLALNFSVFYYEILNSPDQACQIAKQVRSGTMILV